MSYSEIALLACLLILVVVAFDWWRGRTGLAKLHLTKDQEPERFWMAIALYLNMAFGLFWLSGQTAPPSLDELADENGVIMLTIEPQE